MAIRCLDATRLLHQVLKVPEADNTCQRIVTFLEDLTEEHAIQIKGCGIQMWHVTVGPHDALYVPAGVAVGEQVIGQHDVVGLRVSVLVCDAGDKENEYHTKALQWALSEAKLTKKAVDVLEAALALGSVSAPTSAAPVVAAQLAASAAAPVLAPPLGASHVAASCKGASALARALAAGAPATPSVEAKLERGGA